MDKIIFNFTTQNLGVDSRLREVLQEIVNNGVFRDSRAGSVKELSQPTTILWPNETPFISTDPIRDANPFFALFESVWMLQGRNDLAFLLHFNSTFGQFSDDGKEVRGSAYGKRWRSWFKLDETPPATIDQFPKLIKELADNPLTRRAVLLMWDAQDLNLDSKDVPCNTQIYFLVRNGRLDMTVTNRSNDAIYGLFGSNVVHFHILHSYITMLLHAELRARKSEVVIPKGDYYQITNNLHAYVDNPVFQRLHEDINGRINRPGDYEPCPRSLIHGGAPSMFEDPESLHRDFEYLCDNYNTITDSGWMDSAFGRETLEPMIRAWNLHKVRKDTQAARDSLAAYSSGWAQAGTAWLDRRLAAQARKAAQVDEVVKENVTLKDKVTKAVKRARKSLNR